jgi:hypothetical protein
MNKGKIRKAVEQYFLHYNHNCKYGVTMVSVSIVDEEPVQ